jgi:hypothetical protein
MLSYRNLKVVGVVLAMTIISCTKLDETLRSTLTSDQTATALGAQGTALLLQAAYSDIGTPFCGDQGQVLSLEENSSDISLVPTRGGDWDDNGAWRIIHAHNFNAGDGNTLNAFNNLNKLNFDATNVLAFNPTAAQAAQARFLRALSLYTLLDLFNQYPIRQPGENLLNAPTVKTGAEAVQFIIDELTAVIPIWLQVE